MKEGNMPVVKHGHTWGSWRFDEKRLYLDYVPTDYNIYLDRVNLVLQVFTSIRQIKTKPWGSPFELENLLRAYANIFASSSKFQKAFKQEIAPRQDQWNTFLKETVVLIRTPDAADWNLKLEEIYKKFHA
jgi:hypothetical protein